MNYKLPIDVNDLTEEQAKDLLRHILIELDALDCEDFFGTEGWMKFFGLED